MENTMSTRQPQFELGTVCITPALQQRLSPADIEEALSRHVRGDWGLVPPGDAQANDLALREGGRLLSSYLAPPDERRRERRFWVITEADRSATTLLFPEEY